MTTLIAEEPLIVRKRADKAQRLSTEESGNSVWCMCTEDLDSDNETVVPSGLDFSRFDLNPCVLDNHSTDGSVTDVILGKVVRHWLDEVGEGTQWPQVGGRPRPAQLCEIEWNTATAKGREARAMAMSGQLNGGSVSFLPKGQPERNSNGGNRYKEALLLEFTLTPVGANPSAIRLKAANMNQATASPPRRASVEKRGSLYYVRMKAMDLDAFVQAVLHALPFAVGAGQLGASIINIINGLRKMGKSPKEVANEIKDDIKGAKAMKLKRKLWTRGKSALLLKSEGGVDSETADYLKERGLDDVQIVDQPPAKAEPGTPEWEEEEEMEPEHQEKALTVEGDDASGWFVVDTDSGKKLSGKMSSKFQAITAMGKIAAEQTAAARSTKATDDYATAVTTALDPATSDEAIDEAMDEEEVPVEMRAAVKSIVRRSIQKDGGDIMAGKVPHDTDPVPTSADDLQKAADGIALRAKELMNKGADEEGAVAAAMKEADVPEEVAKKIRKRALKAIRKSFSANDVKQLLDNLGLDGTIKDHGPAISVTPSGGSTIRAVRDALISLGPVSVDNGTVTVRKSLEKQRADDETLDSATGAFIEPLTEPEAKVKDALQDCVSAKIAKLVGEEGYDQKQAAAVAYSMCGEHKGLDKNLRRKLKNVVIASVLKKLSKALPPEPTSTNEVTDEQKRKAAADADQQTSTALADLQKSIKKRPALSKANAKTIRKAAEDIMSASLKDDMEKMACKAAEDETKHFSKSFRKAIARKKLKRKEVAALEAAAKELDDKVSEKNGGAGIAEPDTAERLSKLARKLRKIAAKRGKHKGADDGQQTSLAAEDLQKALSPEQQSDMDKVLQAVQQKPGLSPSDIQRATGLNESRVSYAMIRLQREGKISHSGYSVTPKAMDSDPEADDHAMAEKIRALTEKADDVMAKCNKTNETLYRATGLRAFSNGR